MSRTPKGNNASALANGNRLAADLTHGVTCSFAGGCRVFDPNISKEHEDHWLRVRAKQRKAAAFTGHIPSFLDPRPTPPKAKAKKATPKVQGKSQKQLRREAALAELGMTEAQFQAIFGA